MNFVCMFRCVTQLGQVKTSLYSDKNSCDDVPNLSYSGISFHYNSNILFIILIHSFGVVFECGLRINSFSFVFQRLGSLTNVL